MRPYFQNVHTLEKKNPSFRGLEMVRINNIFKDDLDLAFFCQKKKSILVQYSKKVVINRKFSYN